MKRRNLWPPGWQADPEALYICTSHHRSDLGAGALISLYLIAPQFFFLGEISALVYLTGLIHYVVQFSYRLILIPDKLLGRVTEGAR